MISKKRDGSIVTFIGNNFISLKRRGANRISPLSLLPSNLFDRITIIHRIAYVHFLEIRSRLPMIGRYSLASVSIQPHPTSLFLSLSLPRQLFLRPPYFTRRLITSVYHVVKVTWRARQRGGGKKFLIHRRACVLYSRLRRVDVPWLCTVSDKIIKQGTAFKGQLLPLCLELRLSFA